jgi:hypothetical protein
MTRPILERFIAQFGIVDASILLHRHPLTLEGWRNGQADIPAKDAKWLAGWIDAWRSAYTPEQIEKIEALANSKGVELDELTAAELWEIAARDNR